MLSGNSLPISIGIRAYDVGRIFGFVDRIFPFTFAHPLSFSFYNARPTEQALGKNC